MIAHVVTLVVAIVACTALMVAVFVLAWRKTLVGLLATGFVLSSLASLLL